MPPSIYFFSFLFLPHLCKRCSGYYSSSSPLHPNQVFCIICLITQFVIFNVFSPHHAFPSCQCHRQMSLHKQRCRDQSSYGFASTIQHFILSSLPLFAQFHSEILYLFIFFSQCHLANTISLHHCLFIPDPFL